MTMWKKLSGGAALAVLASAAIVQTATAQQTTSAVRGTVMGPGGAPVTNADIRIVHTPTGAAQSTGTNSAGVFDAQGLRVGGPYTITVSAPNLAVATYQNVYLSLGDPLKVDFDLQPLDTVTLEGQGVNEIRMANTGTQTVLGRDSIETVVTTRRDIRDVARRDPLVTLDNVTRSTGPAGGIYIAGSTPRANRITIDGIKSHDDFGINTGGLSTTRGPISIEAIEQMTIQPVPFDVSEGDFTGGAINLVLRGGTNEFHGSIFGNYQNEGYAGERLDSIARPIKVKLENSGGFLAGPIIPDTLFFAASLEYFDSLDANGFNGPIDLGFAGAPINGLSGGLPRLTSADLAGVVATYNSYAVSQDQTYSGRYPTVTPTTDQKRSLRLDWNVSDQHRAQASYRHAESSLFKPAGSATTISPIENWYVQSELEDNYALQLNSAWNDHFSTEARIAYRSYIRGQDPIQGQNYSLSIVCMDPTAQGGSTSTGCTTNVPSWNMGPDVSRHANKLKTENLSTELLGTYSLGTHLFKAGVQTKTIDIFNVFVQRARGSYYFDSQADFASGKVNRLLYTNHPSGDPTRAAAVFDYTVASLFAQDSWDVTEDLTFNIGARWDKYTLDAKPALNTNFVNRYGFDNTRTYDGLDVLMPRISARWNATDDLTISAGVGLFSGGIPDVFISNSFSNTGALTYDIDLQRSTTSGTGYVDAISNTAVATSIGDALMTVNKATYGYGVPAIANTLFVPTSSAARTASTNSLAPNFEMPSDWKANLSIDYALPDDWMLGFDFVASRSKESIALRDIRSRLLTINGQQQFSPDGRIRYDGLNIAASTRATLGLPTSSITEFSAAVGNGQDLQAYNPGKESWSETTALSIAKTFDFGLDFSLAYVHQDAKSYGMLSEFGTTAGGFYGEQMTKEDPNGPTYGIPTNRIKDQWKLTASYEMELVEGFKSRFTFFGERRSGRPFNFTMSDAATTTSSARGPVFGVNHNTSLLYVPNMASPDTPGGLKFTSPIINPNTGAPTVVFFDSAATRDAFAAVVNRYNLPVNAIVPKNFGINPDVESLDFQFAQEIPSFIEGHKLTATMDVKNLLNFLNNEWGLVKEYTDSRGGASQRVVAASCADASGAALGNTTAACPAYRYSLFNSTGAGAIGSNQPTVDPSSRWYVQFGLKYSF